jgi:signal transduction histidine kinase
LARPVLLAIEDDSPIVELLSTIAEPLDLEVAAAPDGKSALAILDRLRPALITLDLVLPDVDGFAVLEVVRSRPLLAEVPVLVITALGDARSVKQAYELGASDLINKPFNVGVVEAKLRTLLKMVRLAEEVRQRQEFLEEVMEHVSSGLLVCDAAGRLSRLNPAGASALGLDDAEGSIGRPLSEVAPGAEAMIAAAPLAEAQKGNHQRRARVRRATGDEHVLGFTTTRLAGGGCVAVFRELSEAEVARREADERSRHESLARGARSFAHEVRNPLAAIAAAAQVLSRDDADAPLKRRLARAIETESMRVASLVAEYVERQVPPVAVDGADIASLLEEVVEVNLLGDPARGRVSLELAPGLPRVAIDPARLKQVVLNLVFNAVAATESGGSIVIAAAPDDEGVRVEVRDGGAGIAPHVLPRIFDEAFTTRDGGQGLGLAIARRIVQQHGGSIAVESAPGQGAAFTVRLRPSR